MKKWYCFDVSDPRCGNYRLKLYEDDFPTPEAREEYCRKECKSYTYVGYITEPQIGDPVVYDGKEYSTEAYQELFGKISFPKGFEDKLREKDLAGQMDFYRITENSVLAGTAYGEAEKSGYFEYSTRLQDYSSLLRLIVKDGMIVGVRIKAWPNEKVPLLPYGRVCTYYASDNEGSGTKDRTDYAWLICVQKAQGCDE